MKYWGKRAALGLAGALSATLNAQTPVSPATRPQRVDVPSLIRVRPLTTPTMRATAGPRSFTSEHRGIFNGLTLPYRAELSETTIELRPGVTGATMFSTSYIVTGRSGTTDRPVVFLFNGGPGGSSAFLHFTVGPKRLSSLLTKDFTDPANGLVDNSASLLDAADLVFVDPIDTGFGRSLPAAADQFRSVDKDSEAMSRFVLHWLQSHGRMASPKYVLGESYGSMRAVAMARDLARGDPPVVLDGVILVGQAIDFAHWGRTADAVRTASGLPSMASVAWHYGKIDKTRQTWIQAVDRARSFARTEYLPALSMGYQLDRATFDRIVRQLPQIVGIPEAYFRTNDTIIVRNFNAELLRDRGLVLNRNDGLQTNRAPAPGTPPPNPYARGNYLAFSSNMERYAAQVLGARGLGPYTVLSQPRPEAADWDFETRGAPNLSVTLGNVLHTHPSMRLLVLQGRYDMLTDLGATEATMAQTDLPPDRYTYVLYDGGHMLSAGNDALEPLRSFVRRPHNK